MAEDRQITIVDNHDDWMGIYVDGELVHEEHRIRLKDGLEALGIDFEEIFPDGRWLYEVGRLPKKLEDVQVGNEDDDWSPEDEWGNDDS